MKQVFLLKAEFASHFSFVKSVCELCLADFIENYILLHGRQLSATICILTKRRLIDTQFVTINKDIAFKKSHYLPSDQRSFVCLFTQTVRPRKINL